MSTHDDSTTRRAERFAAYLEFSSLVRNGSSNATFLADGRCWFVTGAPSDTTILVFDPRSGSLSPMFDAAGTRRAYVEYFGHEPAGRGLPFDSFRTDARGGVVVTLDGIEFYLDTNEYRFSPEPKANAVDEHLGTSRRHRLTPKTFRRPGYFVDSGPVPEALSPDGRLFAGLESGNVSIRSTADGRCDRLTHDAAQDNGWDIESTRMGVGSGGQTVYCTVSPWSPDSLRLYATRFDTRAVGRVSRIRYLRHFDEVETLPMTRAGDELAVVEPFILDTLGGRRLQLKVETRDCLLLLLGWADDGRHVYLFRATRDMRHIELLAVDASSGEPRTLVEEHGTTFLRIQHDVIAGQSGCTVLPGGAGLIWESERDGWKHLYHYDATGRLLRQLTSGDWPVCRLLAVDPASEWLYFTAHHDSTRPYDVHICRVPLRGGEVERLTTATGVHHAQMAPDASYMVVTRQRPDLPPHASIYRATGEVLHSLPPMDTSALERHGWTAPEEAAVLAADRKTQLWAVMYKPADFDPQRRYPVIEYIYGGPQVSMVNHGFALGGSKMSALNLALPQLGYVVVVVDARGTPERSKAFQDVTFGDWRRHVTADHAAALRGLAKDRPWMDLSRVGLWGHSWGGYFTVANLLDNPDLYRAGVASAPGFDAYDMFIHEPYLGGPPSAMNKAAYDDANLVPDAGLLHGQLMIIAGSNDVIVWHDAVKMTNALIEAGKVHEFVMLPNQHHGFGSVHETYFVSKLTDFFDKHVMQAK